MSVLITSDWHLNDKVRDRYRHDWQKQLRELLQKHDVDTLLMLGDLTDELDNHSATLVNEVVNYLTAAAKLVDRIYIMRGNHDCVDPTTPFFKFVSELPKVTWVNSPGIHAFSGMGDVLFLPNTRDYKTDWAGIVFDVDFVVAHNTFAGTIAESGHELGGVPPSVIPKHLKVISGDIHKPQDVQHITYVGSPYTIDFGDSFDPRVLLVTNGRVKSIPCRGPQKRLITAPNVDAVIAKLKTAGDDIVKLRVTVSADEVTLWPKTKRMLIETAESLGVRLHAIEAITEATLTPTKRYTVKTKTKRDDEVLKEYCRDRGTTREFIDEGLSIIKEK